MGTGCLGPEHWVEMLGRARGRSSRFQEGGWGTRGGLRGWTLTLRPQRRCQGRPGRRDRHHSSSQRGAESEGKAGFSPRSGVHTLHPLWKSPAPGLTEVMKYLWASTASIGWRFPKPETGLPTREKLRRKMMGVTESSTQAWRMDIGGSSWLRNAPSQPLAGSSLLIRKMEQQWYLPTPHKCSSIGSCVQNLCCGCPWS